MRIIYIGILLFIFLIVAIKINIFNLKKRQVNHNININININAQLLITNKDKKKYILYGYYNFDNQYSEDFLASYYRDITSKQIYKFDEKKLILVKKSNNFIRIEKENAFFEGAITGLAVSQIIEPNKSILPYILGGGIIYELIGEDLLIKNVELKYESVYDFDITEKVKSIGENKFSINQDIFTYELKRDTNLNNNQTTKIYLDDDKYEIEAQAIIINNQFLILEGNKITDKITQEQYITKFIGYKYIRKPITGPEAIGAGLGAIIDKEDRQKGAGIGLLFGRLTSNFIRQSNLKKGTQINIIFTMDTIKINNQIE